MIDNDLLKKYNKPVPRYTSYPPANFFTEEFQQNDLVKAIEGSNDQQPANLSFYFHIPFCKRLCYFCGCNSYGYKDEAIIDQYIQALKKELQTVISKLDKKRPISQIHYGGGTPNAVPIHYLKEINQILFDAFPLIDQPEIAIECNPAYLSYEQMDELKEAGFRRFSLGIQDFDKAVLDAVNRDEPSMPVKEIIGYLKKDDPSISVNLDFIYGLPKQTVENFTEAIQQAIELKPDRLVTFSYAHVPWVSRIQKKLEKVGLPESGEKMQMFEEAYQLLTTNGYQPIGFDHFALESDELSIAYKDKKLHRNFQGYCTKRTTGQVYAIGVTAISQLNEVYAQNTKSINEYIEEVNAGEIPTIKGYQLSQEQIIIREVITELMCNERVIWNEIGKSFGKDATAIRSTVNYDQEQLQQFVEDGIITLSEEKLEVTDKGLILIRNVAASLDPLLIASNKTFSKSV